MRKINKKSARIKCTAAAGLAALMLAGCGNVASVATTEAPETEAVTTEAEAVTEETTEADAGNSGAGKAQMSSIEETNLGFGKEVKDGYEPNKPVEF